ncbi:hypothetical protein MODO_2670 [Myroides odoratimimus]|nr:hypothetical protein MODO_2670 [Myroides odoratimimus]
MSAFNKLRAESPSWFIVNMSAPFNYLFLLPPKSSSSTVDEIIDKNRLIG